MDQAPKSHELGPVRCLMQCKSSCHCIAWAHMQMQGREACLQCTYYSHGPRAHCWTNRCSSPGSCMVQGSRHKLALRILAFLNERVHSVILHSAAALLSRAVGITEWMQVNMLGLCIRNRNSLIAVSARHWCSGFWNTLGSSSIHKWTFWRPKLCMPLAEAQCCTIRNPTISVIASWAWSETLKCRLLVVLPPKILHYH
jgi:hypothetical protein